MVAGDDFAVGGVPAEGHGPGKVGGLGGQPQVPIADPDAQGFAAEMFTDKVGGQLPTVGDHEGHAVGGNCATMAVLLPGESAVAVGGGNRPYPDPTPLTRTADNLAPEALLGPLGERQIGVGNDRDP